MSESILTSTKKMIGIDESYTAFDIDIINHINTVFSDLAQLGVGPAEGFMITDDTVTWSDFLSGDLRLNNVKTYMYFRVRLIFDPPTTSYLINAMDEQRKELEWRILAHRESLSWTDPDPEAISLDPVLDGGTP